MKKLLTNTFYTFGLVFFIWCAISTVEVWAKNLEPNPQYSSINFWILLSDNIPDDETETQPHTRYTAYGRYYTNGTVITDDGNEWSYSTDTISDQTPTDNMPVWVGFDDNGTPDSIEDDIVLGLVYDRETAIYDDLETALSNSFELERDDNNIKIGGVK